MTTVSEFSLIDRLLSHQPKTAKSSDLVLGPGDDCAVVQPTINMQQVMTTDTLISGRHFLPEMPAELIGYRSLAVNISDIAAMAAKPKWLLCSLNLPQSLATYDFIDGFAKGFFALSSQHNATLIGGNMTQADTLSISITAIGETAKPITRSGAKADDLIFVTGAIGAAAIGLTNLQRQLQQHPAEEIDWLAPLASSYCKPTSRVDFALAIADHVTALIDISDGFAQDLTHLAKASNCLAVLNGSQLPRHEACFGMDVRKTLEYQLNGGDDYELIGCCSKADFPAVAKAAKAHNTPLQMVGFIKELPQRFDSSDNCDNHEPSYVDFKNTLQVPIKGYDHFL